MKLIECAKALNAVFNEDMKPQELIDAMKRHETMEMEQILMQEEVLAAEAEEEAEYTYAVNEPWKQAFMQNDVWDSLCEEVDAEYGVSLKTIYKNYCMEV